MPKILQHPALADGCSRDFWTLGGFALSNLEERVDYRVVKYLMPRIGVLSHFGISRSLDLSEFPTKRILQSLKRDLADSKSPGRSIIKETLNIRVTATAHRVAGKFREWPRSSARQLLSRGIRSRCNDRIYSPSETVNNLPPSFLFALTIEPTECQTLLSGISTLVKSTPDLV